MTTIGGGRTLPKQGAWFGSDYLDDIFDPDSLIADARVHLAKSAIWFNTLVGTGLSGALIIPILALELNVDYVPVRAAGQSRHARTSAEGYLGSS